MKNHPSWEAVEFLGMDLEDEAGSVSPAEYAQKYFIPFMQVADCQVVGNSDNPCHNGTDIIDYGAQDDPFAGSQGSVRHFQQLISEAHWLPLDPRLFDALSVIVRKKAL